MSDEMYTVVWMDVKDQTLKRIVNGGIKTQEKDVNRFGFMSFEFSKRTDISLKYCEKRHAGTCTKFSTWMMSEKCRAFIIVNTVQWQQTCVVFVLI